MSLRLFLFLTSLFAAGACTDGYALQTPLAELPETWKALGEAMIEDNHVFLTNGMPKTSGVLYNTQPCDAENWEVTIDFSIKSSRFLGGDGLVFWYLEDTPATGDMFGASSTWSGFGVLLDSKTRDPTRHRPRVAVLLNDGSSAFETGAADAEIASVGCEQFRKADAPVHLRVLHDGGMLTVSLALGDNAFVPIVSDLAVGAARGGWFALSASAPHGSVDRHEILGFAVRATDAAAVATSGDARAAPSAAFDAAPLLARLTQLEAKVALLAEDVRDAADKAGANVEDAVASFESIATELSDATADADRARTAVERLTNEGDEALEICERPRADCKRGTGRLGALAAVVLGVCAARVVTVLCSRVATRA